MSILSKARDFLSGTSLRNKPDGVAWINALADQGAGSGSLVGAYVTTRRILHEDFWEIDPPQRLAVTQAARLADGSIRLPGEVVTICAVRDALLTPIDPRASLIEDEDRELIAPKTPEVVS